MPRGSRKNPNPAGQRKAARTRQDGPRSGVRLHGDSTELRDPQLATDPDNATQRIGLGGTLPVSCYCGRGLRDFPQPVVRAGDCGWSCGRQGCEAA